MSHCAPKATLKPKRFEFTLKTVITDVFVAQVYWEAVPKTWPSGSTLVMERLLQTSNFWPIWRFACSQYGFNSFATWNQRLSLKNNGSLRAQGPRKVLKVVKSHCLGALL